MENYAPHIVVAIIFGPIVLGALSLILLLWNASRTGKTEKPETEKRKKMEDAVEWIGKAVIMVVEIAITLLGIWGIYHFIKRF